VLTLSMSMSQAAAAWHAGQAGPGWLQWPIGIGPNMRRDLSQFQFDPIQLERLMQGRAARPEQAAPMLPPQDATLEEAVARFNTAAAERNRPVSPTSPCEVAGRTRTARR
jgi:hypothetical protein